MHDLRAPLFATIALGCGPVLFFRGFQHLRTAQLIRNTPTSRIRSMAMGLVEVQGAVIPRSIVEAPFTGRPCAYWEVDIASRARNTWSVIHRQHSGNPFYLKDETGTALVFPRAAELKLSQYDREEECLGLNLPSCYDDYMKKNVSMLAQVARASRLRFRERVLTEGQAVYVLGSASPRSRAHVVSDGDELAATGTDHAAPRLHARDLRSLDAQVQGVIAKGSNDPTFIISEQSELMLSSSLGLQSFGHIVGGPLLAVGGLAYWLYMLATRQAPW